MRSSEVRLSFSENEGLIFAKTMWLGSLIRKVIEIIM